MPSIEVQLPQDRTKAGSVKLVDDQGKTIAGPFPALGKADGQTAAGKGNPSRSPTQPYGDTPTGTYKIEGFQQPKDAEDARLRGPFGKISMTPTGGQAAIASANGRTGLQIHGGVVGAGGKLRPTNGCVRLSNQDMASLLTAVTQAGSPPNRCELVATTISVVDLAAPDTGEDLGDPPLNLTPTTAMPMMSTPLPTQPPAPPTPKPNPPTPHDLTPHDRDPHDRDPHDLTPHDLTPHDLTPHDLTPHDLNPHDLTPHDMGLP
jgi:hypothetical protein